METSPKVKKTQLPLASRGLKRPYYYIVEKKDGLIAQLDRAWDF